jgi:hypothetical protein
VTRAETGQNHAGKRPSRSSDQSFWGIGIPSMYGSVSHQQPDAKMRNPLGWWWHTPHDLIDKIDPDFLVRDTRVVLHTLWRLLSDKVLPIDPAAELASLRTELTAIAGSKPAPAMTTLIAAVESAVAAAARLKAARPADDAACEAINAALVRMSRALVPLDYTEGDRFDHDPALPQPPWPVLQGLRNLAAAEPGSDQAKFLGVSAARARNRLLHALEEAARAAGQCPP